MTMLTVGGFRIALPEGDPISDLGLPETYVSFLSDVAGTSPDLTCVAEVETASPSYAPDALRVSVDHGTVRFDGFDAAIDLGAGVMRIRATRDGLRANLDYALRVAVALLAFRSGGLLVHGAGIARGDRGYLFLGPSGTGKTTVSRMSVSDTVLNDDLNVLQPVAQGWHMWGTPFWNPSQVRPSASSCALHRIVRLVQDRTPSTEPMSAALATAALVSSVPVLASADPLASAVFDRCARVASEVPVTRLRFGLSPDFWRVIEALSPGTI